MKKIFYVIILTIMGAIIVGCTQNTIESMDQTTTTPSSSENTTSGSSTNSSSSSGISGNERPVIHIFPEDEDVMVFINQNYNLMEGVYGRDDLDGNITDQIMIHENGYTNQKEGIYIVKYNAKDSSGNQALEKTKTIRVMKNYEVHTGMIQGEVNKPAMPKCFGGAWYHKVVTSRDSWIGIEGTITLPYVNIDRYKDLTTNEEVLNPENDIEYFMKNLDNPSIYMGGNAAYESDVGISLSLVELKDGSISKGSVAFRPFWRYITNTSFDLGGYDLENGRNYTVSTPNTGTTKNCAANYHFSFTQYYYLPGDKIKMRIMSPRANKLQLQIDLIEKSTMEYSVNLRREQNWRDPESFRSPVFHSPGYNTSSGVEFKRVNAIDQSNNEGKEAIPTTTTVLNAIWEESFLYRKINGVTKKVPMIDQRVNIMNCPNGKAFVRTQTATQKEKGGETISLDPKLVQGKTLACILKREEEITL